MLLIYDNDATAYKKVSPSNLGITGGGGGGTDTLQRALRTLGLVEVDASYRNKEWAQQLMQMIFYIP